MSFIEVTKNPPINGGLISNVYKLDISEIILKCLPVTNNDIAKGINLGRVNSVHSRSFQKYLFPLPRIPNETTVLNPTNM